jgi:carboxypeptidase PM20D1
MKKLLLALLAGLLVLVAVVVYRTLAFVPPAMPQVAQAANYPVQAEPIAARLSQAVRFATISQQPPLVTDPAPFEGFITWLETAYPEIHANLKRERIGKHALLFTWQGSNPALKPVLLTAHYDVVPVIPGTEKDWKHPPFEGVIADSYVWGRGTLDDKGALVTIMEGVSFLLRQGYVPARTVYLSFGSDEEIGGEEGAGAITKHLASQGVRLEWSLDEGSFVLDGIVPGVALPAASINVAEKGYLTLDLVARAAGGHSSMPPRETAVGILANALVKLQGAPMPGNIEGLTAESFGAMARHMSFEKRMLFANQWLFDPVLRWVLSQSPGTNASLRTTTAPTMLSGSVKENVLPIEATATVNFRLHPRDKAEDVIAHVTKAVNDDRVDVRRRGFSQNASPVASTESAGFRAMASAVREVYGDVVVAPGLTIAATDSKHYQTISDNAYRFTPMLITPIDLTGFHGTNERLSLDNLVRATRFYIHLLKTTTN